MDSVSNEWQYTILRGISSLVCKLSYNTILSIGTKLGPVYSLIAKKQKKRGMKNAMIGLAISEQEASDLMERLFCNLGRSVMEMLYMPNLTKEFIKEHIELRNAHILEGALAENKGVVVLTAHVGNWEWMGAALAAYGYPTTTLVKKQPNAQFTRLLNEYREMAGMEVFARGGSEVIRAAKAMKQKKLLGFLADQDGYVNGIPVPFLGQESSAVLGPATFAEKFKAPVVPIFSSRKPNGGHVIDVLPILRYEDTGHKDVDLYRLTERMIQVTEDFVKAHPDEWLWFQHRWRTQPHEIIDYDKKMAIRELAHDQS